MTRTLVGIRPALNKEIVVTHDFATNTTDRKRDTDTLLNKNIVVEQYSVKFSCSVLSSLLYGYLESRWTT